MSVEHHREHTEHHEQQNEQLEQAAREKLEQLSHRPENAPDDSERRAEAAREIIHRQEKAPEPQPAAETQPHAPRTLHLNPRLNYAQTLATMQRRLTPVSRSFSKFIHAPAIEKTSEALERTVARPSVVAGASWTALLVGSIFYFTARHYGYMLSGSELLFSFVAGAIVGLVIEGIWRSLRRH